MAGMATIRMSKWFTIPERQNHNNNVTINDDFILTLACESWHN
jgi:hypothetical protein